jgi:LysM repeat protein
METPALLDQLASALTHGELRLFRTPPAATPLPTPLEKAPVPEVAPQQISASFALLAVENESDLPVSDLKLILKLPGAGDQQQATDAAGRIQVHGVSGPSAAVSSKVSGATFEKSWAYVKLDAAFGGTKGKGKRSASGEFAIRVVAYRVRTGDTLESIAKAHRISADDLTKFNWGTTDRKQVDAFLSLMVGCTERGPDGHYRFDDQDSPGTLLVPQPIDVGGLSLDETHVMRLHKLHQPDFTFSA